MQSTQPLTVGLVGNAPLHGKKISLFRRGGEHAEFVWECFQLDEFMDLYRLTENRQKTVEQIREQLIEEHKVFPNQLKRIEWIICRTDGDAPEPIGLTAIADYQKHNQRGEFLIGIPEKHNQRPGIGLEASLLVMEFGFNQLHLHKLMSFVYGYNSASQHNTLELGFIQEGHLRDHLFYKDKGFVDMYQNGMLDSDFRSNQRLARLSTRLLGRDITQLPPEPELLPLEPHRDAFKKALKKAAQERQL